MTQQPSSLLYTQEFTDKEFSQLMDKPKKQNITEVQLDSLALLKIINHCTEKVPTPVTGQLFGLNVNNVLEVTNSYPSLTPTDDMTIQEFQEEEYQYQVKMLSCLQDANVDNNLVGWYQSTYMESFLNANMIEGQYHYQLDFGKKCVCILFDPLRSTKGQLKMSAIRLTDQFMNLLSKIYKQQSQSNPQQQSLHITQEMLSKLKLTSDQMFEELPIRIHNSKLTDAVLFDLEENLEGLDDSELSILGLSTQNALERNFDSLLECIEDLTNEQNKFQYYQRRLAQQKQFIEKKVWIFYIYIVLTCLNRKLMMTFISNKFNNQVVWRVS